MYKAPPKPGEYDQRLVEDRTTVCETVEDQTWQGSNDPGLDDVEALTQSRLNSAVLDWEAWGASALVVRRGDRE